MFLPWCSSSNSCSHGEYLQVVMIHLQGQRVLALASMALANSAPIPEPLQLGR
ncbi:hypothetical protein Sjap_008501 [Stephania japonica]|uniref:Uncharacterized protein n=1 Tax=Stephania japonica TaxID=461633 RepID=A0AAP0JPR6_9MAGN